MGQNKKLKVLLLGATFSTNNLGVGALTAGTIECVLHQFPEVEVCLLDYGKERLSYNFQVKSGAVSSIQLLNMRFSKKFYLKNNIAALICIALVLKSIPFLKVRKKIISKNFYLNHISKSEIVASIAGGDSFSDIYGLRRFFYVSLPQILILLMGKKLVLLPQTLGPFQGMIARGISRYIMTRAEVIYSRDYLGLKQAKKTLGLADDSKKLRFCYDVGFVVAPIKPEKMDLDGFLEEKDNNRPVIGLNISGLLFAGGYTQNNMFQLKIDYSELVYKLIDFLIQKNVTLILIPHVFGDLEGDSVVCEKIYRELKDKHGNRIFLAQGSYDQNEIKYIIGLSDFFIGSRMHACIAALSQNIPAVAIAYSEKFFGVMQSIGVESLVADPRVMGTVEILNVVDEAYSRKDSLSEYLAQKIPKVKETVLGVFKDINSS